MSLYQAAYKFLAPDIHAQRSRNRSDVCIVSIDKLTSFQIIFCTTNKILKFYYSSTQIISSGN